MAVTSEAIAAAIRAAMDAAQLEVRDDSHLHRGHGGWREGGGTHFDVVIRAAAFNGLGRVARSRAVHAVLRDELEGGVHALGLDVAGTD